MRLLAIAVAALALASPSVASERESPTAKERRQQIEKLQRCIKTRKCSGMPRYLTIKKIDKRHRIVITHEKDIGVVLQLRIEL